MKKGLKLEAVIYEKMNSAAFKAKMQLYNFQC